MNRRKWQTLSLSIAVFFIFLGMVAHVGLAQETQGSQVNELQAASPSETMTSPYQGAGPREKRLINITLDNMDIYPVLDQVLGQILGLNYVVDPAIRGTISLHIKGKYTRDGLLDLVNSILQMQGLAITRGTKGLYKVVRKANSAKMGNQIAGIGQRPEHPGDVIQVFQLEYLAATNTVASLRNFLSPGALIVPLQSSNSLIICDTAPNIQKVARILGLLDTNIFKDIHWRLFTLEYTDAEDLSSDLAKIFKSKGLYARPGIDSDSLQIITLKTINAILVVTRWENILNTVGKWIKELDQGQSEKGARVYVYFVQNGQAKDIADLLKQLYGTEGASRASKNKTVIVRREKKIKTSKMGATGELSGQVEIIPDEVNNAIIVKAKPKDYAIIMQVLRKIDVKPRQVLIDVLIFDVTLKNNVQYGVEWFIKNKGIKLNGAPYSGTMFLNTAAENASYKDIGGKFAGFGYSLFDSANGLRSLLTVLAENTDVNILSTPNILAIDNQESTIEVGDDVPTLTGTTVTNGGTTTQSVQYRNAGIILKVKPSINDSGLVRMEITQEVSSVTDETTGGISSPRFKTRKANTTLVAQDGQTIIIGGLIQTQKERINAGIPVLKNLPVLGYFFGKKGFKNTKTELLFAITPHVITSREQADAITREFSQKIKSLKKALGKKYLDQDSGDLHAHRQD